MKIHWALSLLLMLVSTIAIAQEEKKKDRASDDKQKSSKQDPQQEEEDSVEEEPEKLTLAEKFAEIKKAHSRSLRLNRSKMRSAKASEREEIASDFNKDVQATMQNVSEMLEQSKNLEFDMLLWVTQNGGEEESNQARQKLLNNHIDSEKIATLIRTMSRIAPSPQSEAALRRMMADSPHDSVKAAATMGLMDMLEPMKNLAEMDDKSRARIAEVIGEEFMNKWTVEAIDEESKLLLNSILENYADVPLGKSTYGESVEGKIFAMENLQIGCVAEDIVAKDLDGEEFKLSDYRGKVVVLDFWGDW